MKPMSPAKLISTTVIVLILISSLTYAQDWREADFSAFHGLFFGQQQPPITPEKFEPGVLLTSGMAHGYPSFSLNGTEIFWFHLDLQSIFYSSIEESKWRIPKRLTLEGLKNTQSPNLSPDGKCLYFHAVDNNNTNENDYDIYVINRIEDGWGQTKKLGTNINSNTSDRYPYPARNGNMYFAVDYDIFVSKYENGEYLSRIKLGDSVNSAHLERSACIAPDESYIIFESNRPGNTPVMKLYISFKKQDGTWTEAQAMGEMINETGALFPGLTADGKILFYVKGRAADIYWISTEFIDKLKSDILR